jgi:hypothetical protein
MSVAVVFIKDLLDIVRDRDMVRRLWVAYFII